MSITWKAFKTAVEKLGAKDEDIVDYIDVMDPASEEYVFVSTNEIKSSVRLLTVIGS